MEITEEQYARIKDSLPVQRGNVRLTNLQVLNAILYVAEQGCKWRGLPKRFGRWHTIYMRMNRWAKNGVLDRVFEQLQLEQIVRIRIEAFSLDSTSVKVHPDGTGALKKRTTGYWKIPRRMEHQGSYGCRGCSNGCNLRSVSRQRPRCAARAGLTGRVGAYAGGSSHADGSRLRGQ
jgi:transposase